MVSWGGEMLRQSGFLICVVVALLSIGLVELYSATAISSDFRQADSLFFFKKQVLWTLFSIVALLITAQIPLSLWSKMRVPLVVLTFVLLALVYVPGIGEERNGSSRWLDFGGWLFQPSEMAKLTLCIFLCSYVTEKPERLKNFFSGFLPTFGLLLCACGMIAFQRDIGTAIFIGTVMGVTLIVAGIRLTHVVPAFALTVPAFAIYCLTQMTHVQSRVSTWLNPEADPLGKGHQVTQSLIALGSGGLWGEGLGQGTQKLFFLPEVHTDFLFPIIGEELGFIGTLGVLGLYGLLGFAGWRISKRASTSFGFLLSFALTTHILLQAAINIAVTTALLPAKGIPLPLLSYGGSSLLFTMIGIGILVRIAGEGERVVTPESEEV